MNSVKILHCADIHIGASESFLGANSEARRFETLITFERIIDTALENDVKIIAIAGDLFDTDNPDSIFIEKVLQKIASVPQIKTVYCAGNHDPLNTNSPFTKSQLPENLFVLGAHDQCITFSDIKTRVYGRSFESSILKGEETFSIQVPDDDFINIMVQHGELKNDLNSSYNSITPKFIKTSGMDYIALGHVHKHTPIGKIDNTHFAYCGCPEGQGFDELGEKGVYIGEISKGRADLKFISVCYRKHLIESIDITDIEDVPSHIINFLKEKYENYSENLYKIELTGSVSPDSNLNLAEIGARLSQSLYFLKLKDLTELKADLESLAKETSLKGIFVKNMLAKMESAEDKETYKKALNLGLKAFFKEVKYNED